MALTMEVYLSIQTSTLRAYDLIMLDVEDILFLPLTFRCAPASVRASMRNGDAGAFHDGPGFPTATVCGFGHLCLDSSAAFTRHFFFVIGRIASLQREQHKLTDGYIGPLSSSADLLLQWQQPVSLPPQLQKSIQRVSPLQRWITQPPPQPAHSSSWADEVAAEQSSRSTPETVVSNWAYSGRSRGPHPNHWSTHHQWCQHPCQYQRTPSHRDMEYPQFLHLGHNRTYPSLRHMIGRPRPTITPARTHHHVLEPPRMKYILCVYPQGRTHRSNLPDTQLVHQEAHSPRPRNRKWIPSLSHKECITEHLAQILSSTSSPILWTSTRITVFRSPEEKGLTTSPCHLNACWSPLPAHAHWENLRTMRRGRKGRAFSHCNAYNFPINPRFSERLWHTSKYFFTLADCQDDYLNTMFTRDVAPTVFTRNTTPSTSSLVFLHPKQVDVNNQTLDSGQFGEPGTITRESTIPQSPSRKADTL